MVEALMIQAFKYKLNPTVKQRNLLNQTLGNARFVYNWALDKKTTVWKNEGKNLFFSELSSELTRLRNSDEFSWLKNTAYVTQQQALKRLERAFDLFFKKKTKYPRFKSKKSGIDSVRFTNTYNKDRRLNKLKIDFDAHRALIPCIGRVRFRANREFDSFLKIISFTVYRDSCNDFWLIVDVDMQKEPVPKVKVISSSAVGIDLGVKEFATLSDGTKYHNPRYLEKSLKRLSGLQKGLSKTTIGSNRHELLKLKINRIHRKIRNQRDNYANLISRRIIDSYDTICLETLDINQMLRDRKMSRSVYSVSWGIFIHKLIYKSNWRGKNLLRIGQYEPSSKTCSSCGYIRKSLSIDEREWVCPECGCIHDRDVNAAINIMYFALAKYKVEKEIPSESGIMGGSINTNVNIINPINDGYMISENGANC